LVFRPEKSGRTNFRPEVLWVFQISTGKFLGFSNFAPTFFRFFNFQPEIFLVFEISRQKKSGFSGPGAGSVSQGLRRRRESVAELTTFFQLSTGNFLEFSTFNPKFFKIFKFRAEKFLPEKLSRQKNPAVPDFEPKILGRKKFQTVRAG